MTSRLLTIRLAGGLEQDLESARQQTGRSQARLCVKSCVVSRS